MRTGVLYSFKISGLTQPVKWVDLSLNVSRFESLSLPLVVGGIVWKERDVNWWSIGPQAMGSPDTSMHCEGMYYIHVQGSCGFSAPIAWHSACVLYHWFETWPYHYPIAHISCNFKSETLFKDCVLCTDSTFYCKNFYKTLLMLSFISFLLMSWVRGKFQSYVGCISCFVALSYQKVFKKVVFSVDILYKI